MKKPKDLLDKFFIDDAMVEKGYQRCLEGHDLIARVATLERRGGPCPLCGTAFNLVIVDNDFGQFNYYQPSCRCFKRCVEVRVPSGWARGCGKWMIAEKLADIDYCTSCSMENPNPKPKKVMLPRRTDHPVSGKDLATGEKEDS